MLKDKLKELAKSNKTYLKTLDDNYQESLTRLNLEMKRTITEHHRLLIEAGRVYQDELTKVLGDEELTPLGFDAPKPSTKKGKVFALINSDPMHLHELLHLYKTIYGAVSPIDTPYMRLILNKLHSEGLIKRMSHGHYIRAV